MPTYDYECGACEKTFEIFQSIKDKLLKKCPKCSKPKLKRLIGTGGGIIFKGSGFYTTDSKAKPQKEATEKTGTDKAVASDTKKKETTKRIDKKAETKK